MLAERLKYGVYIAVFGFVALFPLKLLYLLSDFLSFLLYRVLKYRRKIVEENLRTSFPEKSDDELKSIAKGFYRQLTDNMVETAKMLIMSDAAIKRRVEVVNAGMVQSIGSRRQSVVLMVGHLGNWEWIPSAHWHFTLPANCLEIYKPPRDKAFDRLMLKIRSKFRVRMVSQHSALRTILKSFSEEGPVIVGFLADQRSNYKSEHFKVEFLNHLTPATVGAEKIGRRIGASFLYLHVSKPGRGRYRLEFMEMEPGEGNSGEYPYTGEYYRLLEENIRQHPRLWLWSHRRWLYK